MVSLTNAMQDGALGAQINMLAAAIGAANEASSAGAHLSNMVASTTNFGTLSVNYEFSAANSSAILAAIVTAMQSEHDALLAQLTALT